MNYAGEVQYFSATLDHTTLNGLGVINGYEYKMLIKQWWATNSFVEQTTASVFRTRATPTLAMATISSPVTSNSYTFQSEYFQAQGDLIKWVRWQIAYADEDGEANPFYDTGAIFGTGQLMASYDGFLTGTEYAVKCTVETQNGVEVTTGWETFTASYALPATAGAASSCMVKGDSCVWVSWDRIVSADGYTVMRQTSGDNRLIKIADVDATSGQIRDYSAKSGNTYTYYVFPTGSLAYLTEPMVSEPIAVQYWFWAIIEAEPTENKNEYSVERTHIFRYNVSDGSINNNNSPTLTQNFTRYPTRQGVSANYATGALSGYIGSISHDTIEYSDTAAQAEALFALSTTTNALFLLDPKGNFRKIHTAAPVTLQVDYKKGVMPQTMTISWVEIGPAEDAHPVMYPGGDFYPTDRIIFSTVRVDTDTGALIWEVPDNYSGTGSVLSLAEGVLTQENSGSFIPAAMSIDAATQTLSAEVPD